MRPLEGMHGYCAGSKQQRAEYRAASEEKTTATRDDYFSLEAGRRCDVAGRHPHVRRQIIEMTLACYQGIISTLRRVIGQHWRFTRKTLTSSS